MVLATLLCLLGPTVCEPIRRVKSEKELEFIMREAEAQMLAEEAGQKEKVSLDVCTLPNFDAGSY